MLLDFGGPASHRRAQSCGPGPREPLQALLATSCLRLGTRCSGLASDTLRSTYENREEKRWIQRTEMTKPHLALPCHTEMRELRRLCHIT